MITHLLKPGRCLQWELSRLLSHVLDAFSPKFVPSNTLTSRAVGWSVLLYRPSQHPVNSFCIPSRMIDIPFRLIRTLPRQKMVITRSMLMIFVKHKLNTSNQQCPTTPNPSSDFWILQYIFQQLKRRLQWTRIDLFPRLDDSNSVVNNSSAVYTMTSDTKNPTTIVVVVVVVVGSILLGSKCK